jgi:uncharacterized protein YqkB
MKKSISIQLKAALLLIVFSMNTVIGLACAMGVDMGFNTNHHHGEEEATEISVYQHADVKMLQHDHSPKEDSEKGGCCNDGVMKFQSLDKNVVQNGNVAVNIPVFVAMLNSFFSSDNLKQAQVFNKKYTFDFFHPPSPDIRILIQSFQI